MINLKFNNVFINDFYSILGKNDHNIIVQDCVDKKINDYYFNQKTVELAEKELLINSIKGVLAKTKVPVDLLILGDLQNQILSSTLAGKEFDVPLLGIYSACASFVEGVIIASQFVDNNACDNVVVGVSSHNLVSEKQFRFPIEYGAIKKKVNTFTATGAVSALVSNQGNIKIESGTIGKVTDVEYKDVNNMGACMAPSAAASIYEHLCFTKRNVDYYDLILTGDLGKYGVNILKDILKDNYDIVANNIVDAGAILFDNESIAGGSGPTCLPLILFNKIIKEKYKKILIVGTGALHSVLSTNLKLSVPSISHAVSLEVQ